MSANVNNVKVLITGADGYIGSNLSKFLGNKEYNVLLSSLNNGDDFIKLDVTNNKNVDSVISKYEPDVIIHTAGLSSLAICEKDPELANKVNFLGTKTIVDSVKGKDVKLVFLSSDYVFDGKKGDYKEEDETIPTTQYGKSKKLAEDYIKKELDNYIIVRTANVYGNNGSSFFNFLMNNFKNGSQVEVFDNVFFTPTYIVSFMENIDLLLSQDFKGTIHVTGSDIVSRYQFASMLAKAYGFNSELVTKIKSDSPLIAKDSSLNTAKLISLIGKTVLEREINYCAGNIIKSYFSYRDDRGEILGIMQNSTWKEINYLRSVGGCMRGGHYHKRTIEGFFIIKGNIEIELKNILSNNPERIFNVQKGDIVIINPNVLHTFNILKDSEWINMLSKEMNHRNPDIYK